MQKIFDAFDKLYKIAEPDYNASRCVRKNYIFYTQLSN